MRTLYLCFARCVYLKRAFLCVQERKRAQAMGYLDPINESYDATTAMYEKLVVEAMRTIKECELGKIAVMMATHNEDTVRFALQQSVFLTFYCSFRDAFVH